MSSRPIVTSVMSSGLGNQLFQYAAAKALSLRLGASLRLDVTAYDPRQQQQEYRWWLGEMPGQDVVAPMMRGTSGRLLQLARQVMRRCLGVPEYHCFKIGFDRSFLEIAGSVHLHGYFQSHLYFDNCRSVIFRDLAHVIRVNRVRPPEDVAVHVRRGDYLKHPGFSLSDPDRHYGAAMDLARKALGPSVRFFVYSDDREWCAGSPLFSDATIVNDDGLTPPDVMAQLASFQTIIIANSSFSWWAAMLGASARGGRVFCPGEWIMGYRTADVDLVPDGWHVV